MDELAAQLYGSISEKNEVRVFKEWHASSIAECPRAHYFKRQGIKALETAGAGKMLRWQAGHIMEEVIRPHLEQVYPDLISNERILSKKLSLTGEYDNYSEKSEEIIEVKSVHDFAFGYRRKGEKRFHLRDSKPYLNHELQNHCYVNLLREKGKPVSSITYVYITLDGRIATYKTAVQSSILDNVNRRLKILNDAWATQTAPPCICDQKDHPLFKSTMQYCDYKGSAECCSLALLNNDNEWSTT